MKYWLLLRGLGRSRHHWGDFGSKFQKALGDDKIIYLDILGNGDMHSKNSLLTIQENTENLRQRLSQLFIESNAALKIPKLNIVAISMGGMIATDWAHRYPNEIESLHIINTSDAGTSRFFERLRFQNYPKLVKSLLLNPNQEQFELDILNVTTNTLPDRSKWAQKFATIPISTKKNWIRQILSASRYNFPKEKPHCAVQIIFSSKDRLVSARCSQAIAKLWKVNPVIHPSAGHDLPLEDGEWLISKILPKS